MANEGWQLYIIIVFRSISLISGTSVAIVALYYLTHLCSTTSAGGDRE